MAEGEHIATSRRRTDRLDGGVTLLVCVVAAVLLWQGAEYVGLVERLGEWQFGAADRYWPTLTVALAVLLALLVTAIVVRLVRQMRERRGEPAAVVAADRYRQALAGETRLLRIAVAIAVIGIVGALFCWIAALRVSDDGRVNPVDVRASAMPPEGPARLVGRYDTGRVALLSRSVLFARHNLYVAPVLGAGGPVRYLVEVERIPGPRVRWRAPSAGLLERYPTARELAPLYRRVGVVLDERPYVLLRSGDTLRWAWWAAAAQFAVFGLIAGAFALLFRRRHRRLEETLNRETAAPAAA